MTNSNDELMMETMYWWGIPTLFRCEHQKDISKQKDVVYSVANGDEPVVCKELYDFSIDTGFEVVCVGKGKNNPLDQKDQ